MVPARETTQLIIAADLSPPGSRVVEIGENEAGARGRQEIPLAAHFRLLRSLMESSADETLHLSMRRLAPGTTDFVIDTLATADDLEDTMRKVARGYNLVHGGDYNHVERRRNRLIYSIDDREFPYAFDAGGGASYAVMEGLLIFVHALLSLAISESLTPYLREVRTRRPQRSSPDGFLAFWDVQVRCHAPVYALEFDLAARRLPARASEHLPRGAGAVYDMIEAMIAAREHSVPQNDLKTRVTRAIAAGVADQSDVADHLGVSIATMRRRLAEAGVSFRDLRSQALNEKAIAMLRQGRSVGDVAQALEFVDSRSFSRAFKSWNGVTPAAFAAKAKE